MNKIKNSSYKALIIIEDIGLLVIAIATIIAMSAEVLKMFDVMKVTLADLLLLFIYLEVLAMIGVYMKIGKLPVRMPLYIAIVAIARYMIIDMKNLESLAMISLAGAVLILAISILAIRYGHSKFPYNETENS